ncbi:hypothetical protein GALMADRAFT_734354 [Galerina marginata CBS 339.88]|uniref:SigF-like NTF2-like domain-containing protein n=1 Tax=Galerina marginata (strain CBS 339.88) TaxID=685588 RepID=A0A067SYL8_GALM3|nr:hypothetical protein GALMADRAFT_734354 [Galerina marginata CBS 339.88]
MQNPSVEIHAVIKLVHSSISPDIQKAAVNKYFAADAAFRHPLYRVEPGPLSRERLLGIYQWYRIISPKIEVDIRDVFYDRLHDIVFVDLAQTLHFRFSPFNPIACRSLSRFTLRKCDDVHYICLQEDFFHPGDLAALLSPPLIPIVRTILFASVIASNILAKWARLFGIWRASDVDHVNAEDVAAKPVKPRPGEGKLRQKNRREVSRAIKRSRQSPAQEDNDLENFTRDLDRRSSASSIRTTEATGAK